MLQGIKKYRFRYLKAINHQKDKRQKFKDKSVLSRQRLNFTEKYNQIVK